MTKDNNLIIEECPFCFEEEKLKIVPFKKGVNLIQVECLSCGARGSAKKTKKDAVGVWNCTTLEYAKDKLHPWENAA